MNIIFYPPKSKTNQHIQLFITALKNNGNTIINNDWTYSDLGFIAHSLLYSLFHKNTIFHFSWLEDNGANTSVKGRIKCTFILLFFSLFRLFGGKIVWEMHNATKHNLNENESYEAEKNFIRKFLRYVNLVIVHCSESKQLLFREYNVQESFVINVPLGNYLSTITHIEKKTERTNTRFLYFGMISKYKGVLTLIKAFNQLQKENTELYICGKPFSDDYKRKIETLTCNNPNIHLKLVFLTDDELSQEVKNADFIVLPYDKESMQNSGAAIFAISCGKPIIIPLFGYIKDIKDKSFILTYDYNTNKDAINNLKLKMEEAWSLKKYHPEELIKMEDEADMFAKTELDWNIIATKITEGYKRISR